MSRDFTRSQIQDMQMNFAKLHAQLESDVDGENQRSEFNSAVTRMLERAHKDVEQKNIRISQLIKDIDKTHELVIDRDNTIEELRENVEELKIALTQQSAENQQLYEQTLEMKGQQDKLLAENEKILAQLNNYYEKQTQADALREREKLSLQQYIQSLEKEKAQLEILKETNQQLLQDNKAFSEQFYNLRDMMDTEQKQLLKDFNQVTQESARLKERLQDRERTVNKLKSRNEFLEQKYIEIKSMYVEAKDQLNDKMAQIRFKILKIQQNFLQIKSHMVHEQQSVQQKFLDLQQRANKLVQKNLSYKEKLGVLKNKENGERQVRFFESRRSIANQELKKCTTEVGSSTMVLDELLLGQPTSNNKNTSMRSKGCGSPQRH